MNLYRSIHVTRLVCFLGALIALVRTNAQDWETIFTRTASNYQMSGTIVLDPSDKWTAQRLFFGVWYLPVNTDQFPATPSPGELLSIDTSTGTYQRAAELPKTFSTSVLGFNPKSGALFVTTSRVYGDEQTRDQLHRSYDRGASWSGAWDTFLGGANRRVAFDDEGTLFTFGGSLSEGQWFAGIRKSTDDAQTWTTVYVDHEREIETWERVQFVPGRNGGLFVTGNRRGGGGIVKRSLDSGATWKTVLTTAGYGSADCITGDPHGSIYVSSSIFGSPIRMSTDGGDTWQILRLPETSYSISGMVTDAVGNLYVWGSRSTQTTSVFRRTLAGEWQDLGPNMNGYLTGVALDAAGNMYAAGTFETTSPERGAIVMRLAMDLVALPPLVVASSGGAVTVSWPTVEGAQLESTAVLEGMPKWEPVPVIPAIEAGKSSVRIENESPAKYFRLSKP